MPPMPRMPHTVTVSTPGSIVVDPVTRNEVPGPPVLVTTRAYLAQRTPTELGAQVELAAEQYTVVSLWTLLVPLSVTLTSRSTVTDQSGRRFAVVGEPASRPDRRPRWKAAALRLVSDLQGA